MGPPARMVRIALFGLDARFPPEFRKTQAFLPTPARAISLRPRVDQLRHPLPCRLIRQPPDAAADVVEHVRRLARPRTDHGDRRVADDVLEEQLPPRLRVKVGRPLRKG